jgi:predicted site-specific integrase-resolvase
VRVVANVRKAALWIGVSERTIRRMCDEGKLEGAYQTAHHGKWLIPYKALEKITPCPGELRKIILSEIANLERDPVK